MRTAIETIVLPPQPFDGAVLRELNAVRDDVITLRDWAFRQANALEEKMARDYERAMLALALGVVGFTGTALALLLLVGRASMRHYDLVRSVSATAREAMEARDLLQEVVEGLPAGVVVYDKDERLVLSNAIAAEISPILLDPASKGMTYEQIVREMVRRRDGAAVGLHEEDLPAWVDRFRRRVPHIHRLPDGRWFEWSGKVTPSGHIIGLRVDITRSKDQELLLARARDRYEALINSLQDMVYALDVNGRFLYASPPALTLLGVKPGDLFGRRFTDFVPPEDIEMIREEGRAFHQSNSQEVHQRSIRIKAADGLIRHVEVRYRKPMNPANSDGAVVIGVMRDVTTTVRMMERLADERTRLRSIVESSGALIVLTDRDLNIEMANSEFWKMRDVAPEQAIGKPIGDLIDCALDVSVVDTWRRGPLLEEETTPIRFANKLVDAEGRTRILSVTAKPIVGVDGKLRQIVFLGVDDTERREAEQALFNADRMATLGEMAATVAHELRQPLQVINLACGAAQDEIEVSNGRLPDTAFISRKLERINGQVERADRIIEDLRLYARGAASDADQAFDPAIAIKAALDMTAASARQSRRKVEVTIADGLPHANGHIGKLEQVLINLLNNARDAGASAIAVSADTQESEARPQVRIVVADNGPGIRSDVLPRLFHSFVTTKPSGKGTGLGLRICRRLVEEMGGSISAANRADGGAEFAILLPAVRRAEGAC
jgi:PAS domain S-box-containing protein